MPTVDSLAIFEAPMPLAARLRRSGRGGAVRVGMANGPAAAAEHFMRNMIGDGGWNRLRERRPSCPPGRGKRADGRVGRRAPARDRARPHRDRGSGHGRAGEPRVAPTSRPRPERWPTSYPTRSSSSSPRLPTVHTSPAPMTSRRGCAPPDPASATTEPGRGPERADTRSSIARRETEQRCVPGRRVGHYARDHVAGPSSPETPGGVRALRRGKPRGRPDRDAPGARRTRDRPRRGAGVFGRRAEWRCVLCPPRRWPASH